jgi:hypothetical protein
MRRARNAGLLTLAAIAAAGSMVAMKTDASAAEAGAIPPVMSCEALANSDFTALDARITSAATATRNGHPFCDVKGYISPVTQFEALLPTETWRGDYLQQGCGGLCGKADVSLDGSVADQRLPGALRAFAERRDGRRSGRSRT